MPAGLVTDTASTRGEAESGFNRFGGMHMKRPAFNQVAMIICALSVAAGVAFVSAGQPPKAEEHERKVKEADVPKPALKTLKKLAGGNVLTELAEEVEHGVTYYEGSWKGPNGKIDALVTALGDLVEIEEAISTSDVPKPVMEKAHAAAGKDAKLYVEKKTVILYEVKFRKDDRKHEIVYSPDGRTHEHEEEDGDAGEDD